MRLVDIAGMRFGRLIAVKRSGTDMYGKILWLFDCDCGNKCIALGNSVKGGYKKSCGCMQKESSSTTGKKNVQAAISARTIHGMSNSRVYKILFGMIRRCNNPKRKDYRFYGGKGVTVCDEWLNNPNKFIEWAMTHGYADNLTIERKDSDKGYYPENCEWIPQYEQARRAVLVREGNRKVVSKCFGFVTIKRPASSS